MWIVYRPKNNQTQTPHSFLTIELILEPKIVIVNLSHPVMFGFFTGFLILKRLMYPLDGFTD